MIKEIMIDGNNFDNLLGFYDEIENKFTKGFDWKIGRNLDAYSDVLTGGFGLHDYKEKIRITWINSSKSRTDLAESFDAIIEITRGHEHIELWLE